MATEPPPGEPLPGIEPEQPPPSPPPLPPQMAELQRVIEASPEASMQLNVLLSSWHSGPLPPAHVLEGYNRVVPDGAERVFRMAEKSLDHQTTIETKLADGSILLAKRAQIWAGCIAILGFVLAGYMAHEGTSGWAFAVAALDVSAIVGYFLGARYITSHRPPPQQPPPDDGQ